MILRYRDASHCRVLRGRQCTGATSSHRVDVSPCYFVLIIMQPHSLSYQSRTLGFFFLIMEMMGSQLKPLSHIVCRICLCRYDKW